MENYFVEPPIFFSLFLIYTKSENAIFDCINDSNARFIKDIMLIYYIGKCVWEEELDLLVIFILVVKVKHMELKVKNLYSRPVLDAATVVTNI